MDVGLCWGWSGMLSMLWETVESSTHPTQADMPVLYPAWGWDWLLRNLGKEENILLLLGNMQRPGCGHSELCNCVGKLLVQL